MALYEITLNEYSTAGAKLDSGHGRSSGPGWTRSAETGAAPSESVYILRRFSSRIANSDGGNSQKPRRPSRRAKAPERFCFSCFAIPSGCFLLLYCIACARARTRGKQKQTKRAPQPLSEMRRTDAAPAEMTAAHLVNVKSSGPGKAQILPGDQLQRVTP